MSGRTILSKRERTTAQVPDPHDHRRGQQGVLGADCRTSVEIRRRAGGACRAVHRAGSASVYQVGQWQRVHRYRSPEWLGQVGVKTLYIAPGSPWENGYNETFNGSLRDELLNGEIFYSLAEAMVMIEAWRHHYKHHPATQQSGLSTSGASHGDTAIAGLRLRFAPPTPGNGGGGHNALTIYPDYPVGAAQYLQ
jgi:hypothetical protein